MNDKIKTFSLFVVMWFLLGFSLLGLVYSLKINPILTVVVLTGFLAAGFTDILLKKEQ